MDPKNEFSSTSVKKGSKKMDKAFIAIVQKLVTEQGKETLLNAAKCKGLLADYTANEYKKESRLLLQAVEAGVAKAIDGGAGVPGTLLQKYENNSRLKYGAAKKELKNEKDIGGILTFCKF
ncbi:hypothetical protein FACS189461_3790 [Spirochaetia bacterium]|nr:hypothetical protein FACS189461_3790 [Spirochaetia bacterium]